MINSLMSQGLYGMQKSQGAMAVNAQEIARGGKPSSASESPASVKDDSGGDRDMASSMIDLKQQQNLFNASAKVVAVANHTLGSLLDVSA